MRIYLSGPVTGQEATAYERFTKAQNEVRQMYDCDAGIIDPFTSNIYIFFSCRPDDLTHDDYMAVSMAMLSVCDAIYMMRGWEKSAGCMEEYQYAVEHGYKIFYQEGEDG